MSDTVDTEVWEADPDNPGYLRLARVKTIGEVYDEVRQIIGEAPAGADEYFSPPVLADRGQQWPAGQTACFAVTGGSEGHYTHVEVLHDHRRQLVMLGKTFDGWDAAWSLAKRLAEILGA